MSQNLYDIEKTQIERISDAIEAAVSMSENLYDIEKTQLKRIDDAIEAAVTMNSGPHAPPTTFPYMFWADTTSGKMKQRNAADTAWVSLWNLASGISGLNNIKISNFTRNQADASDIQVVTGVGFQPKLIFFLAAQNGVQGGYSIGYSDANSNNCLYTVTGTTVSVTVSQCIFINQGSSINNFATVKSMDFDGFTLSWTKQGAPSGATTVSWLAFG